VDPRAGLDNVKRKFFLYRDSNSDPSDVQPVTSRYTNYAIPAPGIKQYPNLIINYAEWTVNTINERIP
jgi:hypothetical protein